MKKPSRQFFITAYKTLKALFMLSVVVGITITAVHFKLYLHDEMRRKAENESAKILRIIREVHHPFDECKVAFATKMDDGYTLQYKLEFSDPGNLPDFEQGDILFIDFTDGDNFSQHYIAIDGEAIYKKRSQEGGWTFRSTGTDRHIGMDTYLSATNISLYIKRNPSRP